MRPSVRLTRRSTRLADRSGAWESSKWIIDSLVDSGLIPGDSEEDIDLEVIQERVKTKDEVGVKIEIIWND